MMLYRFTPARGDFEKSHEISNIMVKLGLPLARQPDKYWRKGGVTRVRAKFWFTEFGWKKCGIHIAAKYKLRVKTIALHKVKGDIVYRDKWQVMLLPNRKK